MPKKKLIFVLLGGLMAAGSMNSFYGQTIKELVAGAQRSFEQTGRSIAENFSPTGVWNLFKFKNPAQAEVELSAAAKSDVGTNFLPTAGKSNTPPQEGKRFQPSTRSPAARTRLPRDRTSEREFQSSNEAKDAAGKDDAVAKHSQGNFFRDLPSATVNEKYCLYLNPLWGSAPYQWRREHGDFPPGLAFDHINGILCGTPTLGGAWTFQIRIMDSLRNFIVIQYALVVKAFEPSEASGEFHITTEHVPSGLVGTHYFLQFATSGGRGPFTWNISRLPPGLSFESRFGILYGTPLEQGDYQVTVSVKDGQSIQRSKGFNYSVSTTPLYLTTTALPTGNVGKEYFQSLQAQGGQPPYQWHVISGIIPKGLSFDTRSAHLKGAPSKQQSETIRFKVTDRLDNSDSADLKLHVASGPLANATEKFPVGKVGAFYYFQLQATGGIPPYQWTILSGQIPQGLSFQPEGILKGTPVSFAETDLTLELRDQAHDRVLVILPFKIDAKVLTITKSSPPDCNVGIPCQYQLEAEGGTPPYHWNVYQGTLPPNIFLTPQGLLNGTPTAQAASRFKVRVRDSRGQIVTSELVLVINVESITILSEYFPTAQLGKDYQFQLRAKGGIPPYTWTITAGRLPKGISLSPTGLMSGEPQEIGLFPFNLRVADNFNHFGTRAMHIAVIDRPVKILSMDLPEAHVGVPYSFTLKAEGGISPYHWSSIAEGLPKGLILNSNTGEITGSPLNSGNFSVTFKVEDTIEGSDVKEFTLRVKGGQLSIVNSTLIDGRVGIPYQETFLAQGGTPPYRWNRIAGQLPDGLNLNSITGMLTGTPAQVQMADFTVQVEDQNQIRNVKPFRIRIENQLLTITTQSLPEGQVGVGYQVQLTAVGGTRPYRWENTPPNLPQGLSLDTQSGVLSGTPLTPADNLAMTLRVSDKENNFSEKVFPLTIRPADLGPVTGFLAQGSDRKAGLAWVNPTSPHFDQVKIIRKIGSYPTSPTDGSVAYAGQGNNTVDLNLMNETTYYYAAFAYHRSGSFSPPGPTSRATATPHAVTLTGPYDPFADEVVNFSPLDPQNCFGLPNMPKVVLGPPQGAGEFVGSLDVVSLHAKVNNDKGASAPYGGSITLKFSNNIVVNGLGADFTVFENAFRIAGAEKYFIEPVVVDVSYDGANYFRFPFDFVPHYNQQNQLDLQNPFSYPIGFAGVKPVLSHNGVPDPTNPKISGGDAFDLDNISSNIKWIQYIRITSTGDNWLRDLNGDYVRHTHERGTWGASGTGNSGFDLDAVAAVNY